MTAIPSIPKFAYEDYADKTIHKKVKKSKKNYRKKNLSTILVVVLSVLTVGLGVVYYNYKKDTSGDVLGQINIDPKEHEIVLNKLKKLIDIDDDEKVNIALINNTDSLKKEDPSFYKDATKGQYLIVIPSQQKILIYDKKTNKVVNFSNFSVDLPLIPEKDIPKTEQPLNIEIRYEDGASETKIKQVKDLITKSSKLFKIADSKITKNNDYKNITVIVLNTTKKNLNQNILSYLKTNNVLTKLPDNEEQSKADVIVVINKD